MISEQFSERYLPPQALSLFSLLTHRSHRTSRRRRRRWCLAVWPTPIDSFTSETLIRRGRTKSFVATSLLSHRRRRPSLITYYLLLGSHATGGASMIQWRKILRLYGIVQIDDGEQS